MSAMAQSEVYAPNSLQLWRTMLNWLAFLVQIFVQIVRGTPSLSQVFSFVGFSQTSLLSPPPPAYKPLSAVEIPLQSPPGSTTVDIDEVEASLDNVAAGGSADGPLKKLTSTTTLEDHPLLEKQALQANQYLFSLPIAIGQVVLDLDETLVCAYEKSSLPPLILTQAIDAGLKWFELECVSSDKEYEGRPRISYVTVFERPGLHEFLDRLSEFADLVLFTAGLEGYARPLVDKIDMQNRFSQRLYRPSTSRTEYRDHVKDLSCLSKDLCRMVIVDNNPFSFLLQPLNGIPCIPFSAGQPHDDQLLEVLLPLLKHLSHHKDVRPILYEKFHMPEWFQKHGIPASSSPL